MSTCTSLYLLQNCEFEFKLFNFNLKSASTTQINIISKLLFPHVTRLICLYSSSKQICMILLFGCPFYLYLNCSYLFSHYFQLHRSVYSLKKGSAGYQVTSNITLSQHCLCPENKVAINIIIMYSEILSS